MLPFSSFEQRRAGEERVSEPQSPPVVGDTAPEFELPGSDGKTHRLADHLGQRVVLLAWFPKAYTPG
jgi:peroxiredoxin Q/BCP